MAKQPRELISRPNPDSSEFASNKSCTIQYRCRGREVLVRHVVNRCAVLGLFCLQPAPAGFQHQLLYDDVLIITDEDRPALGLGASRAVRRDWVAGGLQALHIPVVDNRRHTLQVRLREGQRDCGVWRHREGPREGGARGACGREEVPCMLKLDG
jgi:hypothetical protein